MAKRDAIGVCHRKHASPTVVSVTCSKAVDVVGRGNGDGAYLADNNTEGVVGEFPPAGSVLDKDRTAAVCTNSPVGVCHIVTHDITITFLC